VTVTGGFDLNLNSPDCRGSGKWFFLGFAMGVSSA
jgi:hypothetical protein